MRLALHVDARQLEALVPDFANAVRPFAHVMGEAVKEHVVAELQSGPPRSQTGALSKSFHFRVVARGAAGRFSGVSGVPTSADVLLESDAPQAGILNKGGVIKPKTARYLTIPIVGGQLRGGKGRFLGAAHGLKARDIPDLVLRRSKAGNLLLGQLPTKPSKTGRRGKPTGRIPPVPPNFKVAFLLKQSVTIPAFGYVDRAVAKVVDKLADTLADMADRGLGGKAA